MFITQFTKKDRVQVSCSEKEKDEWKLKDGKPVKTGKKENFYNDIQANADNANIQSIIRRVQAGQMTPNLATKEEIYADVREFQDKTIHDLKNEQTAAEQNAEILIDNLPEELKNQYHNDREEIRRNIANGNILEDVKRLNERLLKEQLNNNIDKKDNE